ncbi:MAG: UbiA family prenyltransferase [Bacteroidota bacterium]
MNQYSKPEENNAPLLKRLWIYQRERFPVFGHGPLVAAFSFSAISYSRICRGADGFVSWPLFGLGIFTTITLFLLVRIFDEFKDASDDAKFRSELPVPRGLVKLSELRNIGIGLVVLQIILNAIFAPKLLIIWAVVLLYLSLMGKEFFVAEWLKKHQFWYVVSHMFIIPLIDIYASGLDWLQEGVSAPKGLLFFFAVSYFNGIVLEVGRKIRIPEDEKEGVLTYSSLHGARNATLLWLLMILVTAGWAVAAVWFAGYGMQGFYTMLAIALVISIPAIFFLQKMTAKRAKMIEYASALWTIAMYLSLGGIPMAIEMLK